MPPLRKPDSLPGPGRREPNRVLVPDLPANGGPSGRGRRRGRSERVTRAVTVRSPHLRDSLRRFCLGAFKGLAAELEAGAELPFAFEEHSSRRGPALYEYRPLVRGFVDDREGLLRSLPDTALALEDLRREPSAAIFARAHAGAGPTEDDALFHSVLLPMVSLAADRCGGFDWHDDAFERAYVELEQSLFGSARSYSAVAPLVGLSTGGQLELGDGIRVRAAAAGELARLWPESHTLLPDRFGREVDRMCVLELARELDAGDPEPPDAPGELADAVSALRLATAGPIAAGPVIFERLDWRPLAIRPVLPIAATQPIGEPTRLDPFRAKLAADLRGRLLDADGDPALAEALDRWELSLFQSDPFRSEQLRESLTALLGGDDGTWAAALRASTLLAAGPGERAELFGWIRDYGSAEAADAVRRALVETLVHGSRDELVASLDEAILGVSPRPAGRLAAPALAG
jgi:hypothetical protein